MKIFDDLYVYPWRSYQENNCNTIFIDGEIPFLVDPGHSHLFGHVVEGMARDGKVAETVKAIICTHSHPDHIEAIERFDNNVLKGIGASEFEYMKGSGKELFLAGGCQIPRLSFKILLKDGMLQMGEKRFQVITTPGHSPGSICLYWEQKRVLISGDTIFYMGVGRADLPGGDMEQLSHSIRELSRLPIDFLIPGHGEIVKGAETIEKNFRTILGEFF